MSRRTQRGFTLIEMVVVMVLLAIVAAIGGLTVGGAFRSYFAERDISGANAQAASALARLARSLRAIRTPTTADLTPGATTLSFVNTAGLSVTYAFNAAQQTLTRAENGAAPQVLADHVTGGSFSYWQRDGATVATTADVVYYISVQLTVQQGIATQSYQITVHPRNFG
ncbi:MAG TPA: type II secretion system protein [Acidiferrobacteraceae bacterium]|nr:type II secretion system protein [Acidiferrobacteraceae bacterium]